MDNCTYTIKGNKFNSYSELFEFLNTKNIDLGNVSDVVYSKVSKQEDQINKLKQLKQEYKPKETVSGSVSENLDGEPSVDGRIHVLNFLDMPGCAIQGRRLITPLSKEEYVNAIIGKLKKDTSLNLTDEQLQQRALETVQNWKTIQEDALLIHQMFTDSTIMDRNSQDVDFVDKYSKEVKGTRINDVLLKQLYNGLKKTFYIREKGKYPDSKTITNVNLVSKLLNQDNEIFGHIDYLFVGEDGTLHLYLFKTTSEHPSHWVNVKQEKYKYQLAFLKQMLANNGVDVSNIDLNIVPVQLTYDQNYQKIQSVRVLNAIQYSTRYSGNEYAMAKYDRQVRAFVQDNSVIDYIPEKVVERANTVNRAIFPELKIKREGYIGQSAKLWIARAPGNDPTGTEPLVIKETDGQYEVIINGKSYQIKSGKYKTKNQEIIDLVSKHIDELEDYKGYSTQRLKEMINNSYRKGFLDFSSSKGFEGASRKLNLIFGKYFSDYEETRGGAKIYNWELLTDLVDANVLVFFNRKTNILEMVSVSAFDLNSDVSFAKGDHVLGSYLRDNDQDKSRLAADYGNIEAVRAMELLNEMLPKLLQSKPQLKLGTLTVMSAIGKNDFRPFHMGEFNRRHFQNILKVVNRENKSINIQNNFQKVEFTNPIDIILEEYQRLMEGRSEAEQNKLAYYGFDQLAEAETIDQQKRILLIIANKIMDSRPQFQNPDDFQRILEGTPGQDRDMARLLDLVAKAYGNISGETPTHYKKLQPFDKWAFTATTVPDPNIQIVVNNLQTTHDAIASEFLDKWDRKPFDAFYEKKGYSKLENQWVGDQARVYKNLYEVDVHTGKKTMSFKNPYDYSNDLTPDERELLKYVLYQITYINTNGNFKYSNWRDPKIAEHIQKHPEYLWVPLIRASNATRRQSASAMLAGIKNSFKRIKNATERFDEFVNGITPEERELLSPSGDTDFYSLSLHNPFSLSMPTSNRPITETIKRRNDFLNNHGTKFFETNLENILIEFLAKHITTTQYNKLLVASKMFLLELHITGNYGGNDKTVQKEREWYENYLKVNVFNTPIMSEQEQKVMGMISPVRTVVSHMLVGGNIVGAVRDLVEGAQQNFLRAVIKLNTDIDPSNVAKAYSYVMTNTRSNAMSVNLLNLLCLKYRLSNTDVGRIAERAKSGRNGLFNYDNFLYSTLRGPDFINRMTLFVARCMQDGTWDAFSIDSNNNLKYDWKKDSRFSIYAKGLTTHPEYKKQRAAYYSAIIQYNEDHPDNPIDPEDGLPDPYSFSRVRYIRNLADNIYGSYDRGKKSMAEYTSLMAVFGMFTTWFNGIVNNYFMKSQENGAFGYRSKQKLDDQGRPLFLAEDGSVTTENTGEPITEDVPIVVQGIFPMLGTLADIFYSTEGGVSSKINAVKEYLRADQHERANLHKLLSDLLMLLFMSMLFNLAITPAYKDYKKTMDKNPVLVNMATELLYKSTSRAYDQYKGPINIMQFFGENMNPPTYSVPTQLISDAFQTLLGEKSAKYLLFNSSGITRSFKDSGFAFIKSQQE